MKTNLNSYESKEVFNRIVFKIPFNSSNIKVYIPRR